MNNNQNQVIAYMKEALADMDYQDRSVMEEAWNAVSDLVIDSLDVPKREGLHISASHMNIDYRKSVTILLKK